MTLEEKVQDLCKRKGYASRACRFQVISEMLGISPDEARAVESITRTIRVLFPKDSVGEKLEEQYKSGKLFEFENESKKYLDDKIKYA